MELKTLGLAKTYPNKIILDQRQVTRHGQAYSVNHVSAIVTNIH
jgi:hypothetical protein